MGHYYEMTSSGVEPRHFVGVSSRPGELRPTRITDARKHGWHPSVTTIQGLLDKPALTDWKITEHLKQAYHNGRVSNWGSFTVEEWIAQVKRDTQTALDKAPKDGTDFHDSIEKWFKADTNVPEAHKICCNNVYAEVVNTTNITAQNWQKEVAFVCPMGFAGKADLISVGDHFHFEGDTSKPEHNKPTLIKQQQWVIDYKTKNSCDKWKPGKMAYPEMAMQLAAYRVGLGLHNARCANVFICLEDGAVEFYEWGPETLDRQWANFNDLLRIWLRNAEYVPGKP